MANMTYTCFAQTALDLMAATNFAVRFVYVPEYADKHIILEIGPNRYRVNFKNDEAYFKLYNIANQWWCTHRAYSRGDYNSKQTRWVNSYKCR